MKLVPYTRTRQPQKYFTWLTVTCDVIRFSWVSVCGCCNRFTRNLRSAYAMLVLVFGMRYHATWESFIHLSKYVEIPCVIWGFFFFRGFTKILFYGETACAMKTLSIWERKNYSEYVPLVLSVQSNNQITSISTQCGDFHMAIQFARAQRNCNQNCRYSNYR